MKTRKINWILALCAGLCAVPLCVGAMEIEDPGAAHNAAAVQAHTVPLATERPLQAATPAPVALAKPPPGLPPAPEQGPLAQRQFLQSVVARNAEIAFTRLQADVAGAGADAERTLYTPVLYGSTRREERQRQRTFDEQSASLLSANTAVLDEVVYAAEVGVRWKAPSGADLSVGVRGTRKSNNLLQAAASTGGAEANGALVVTVRQPLWRGSGREVTETDLQLAELERQIGRAQFHQQLLRVGADALNAYWQLQRAYSTHPLRERLLRNAQDTLADVRLREGAGRVAPNAEAETAAVLATRQAELTRSSQGVLDGELRLASFLGAPPTAMAWQLDALQVVGSAAALAGPSNAAMPSDERVNAALESWPAWQVARLRLEQGKRRLSYAAEQTKPLLDLQLSYASNGLARTPDRALRTVGQARYPDWYVGLAFEMPFGTSKSDAQLRGQQLKLQQTELEAQTVRQNLAADLYSRQRQIDLVGQELGGLQADAAGRQALLDSESRAWKDGLLARSRVLRREAEWLESHLRVVDAQARLNVARVGLAQAEGRLLREQGVDIEPQ